MSTLEESKAQFTLKAPSGFEPEFPQLEFSTLTTLTIASTLDPKFLGLNLNYIFGQALKPNLKALGGHWIISAMTNFE